MVFKKDPSKVIDYAQNVRLQSGYPGYRKPEREIKDLKHVMDRAMPDEWPDLVPNRWMRSGTWQRSWCQWQSRHWSP